MKRLFLLLVAALVLFVPAVGQAASGPAIAFNPSSNDYGTIDANTTASQTFTLRNSGGKATGALKASLTGSSAFSITADTCTATSLGPRKSCSVTVQYAPTTAGSNDSATLTASSKKPPATASGTLTGATGQTAQSVCESFGGTFEPGHGNLIFACNGWSATSLDDVSAIWHALVPLCESITFGLGNQAAYVNGVPVMNSLGEFVNTDVQLPSTDTGLGCIFVA